MKTPRSSKKRASKKPLTSTAKNRDTPAAGKTRTKKKPLASTAKKPIATSGSVKLGPLAGAKREVAHIRNAHADALRILRRRFRCETHGMAGLLVGFCRVRIIQATADCQLLDGYCAKYGLSEGWRNNLATFSTDGAINSLARLAERTLRRWCAGKTPYSALANKGHLEAAEIKHLLEQIRETLRDGLSPKTALRKHYSEVLAMLENGSDSFFEQLGSTFKERRLKPVKFQRTVSDWLRRNWMTLRLWECRADGVEAYERCSLLAQYTRFALPAYPQFSNAWKAVRSRTFRR